MISLQLNVIYMFQNLKAHINKQNLKKIKQINRYEQQSEDQSVNELDQIEIQQRKEHFDKLIYQDSQNCEEQGFNLRIKELKDWKTQKKINYARENTILLQKIRVIQQHQSRQITLIEEDYERKLQGLKLENDILKISNKQYVKEQKIVRSLRKDIERLTDINLNLQNQINTLQSQLLEEKLKHKLPFINVPLKQEQPNCDERLKGQILTLQLKIKEQEKQLILEKDLIKESQKKYKELYNKFDRLNKDIKQKQFVFLNEIQRNKQKAEQTIHKLQTLNMDLNKKNSALQNSLLEHFSLTSNYFYRTKKDEINSTLNIQQESLSNRKIKRELFQKEDPEKDKTLEAYSLQISELQQKLEKSNRIIAKLLQWHRNAHPNQY